MAVPKGHTARTGIAVGINKGHITTRKELAPKPVNKKGVCININHFFSFLFHFIFCFFFSLLKLVVAVFLGWFGVYFLGHWLLFFFICFELVLLWGATCMKNARK